MNIRLTIAGLYLVLGLAVGCSSPDRNQLDNWPEPYNYSFIDSELWLRTPQGVSHRIELEGQGLHPLASPDGQWLAVEVQLMSNLRSLKIYEKTAEGFKEPALKAATYLWQRAKREDGVDTDNILNPAVRVEKWLNRETLQVVLSCEQTNGKSYQRSFALTMSELKVQP